MSLKVRIQEDMKSAMRAKEAERLKAIRLLLAAIKQREVDERVVERARALLPAFLHLVEVAVRADVAVEDLGVDAGPCGAATLAALRRVLADPARREALGLDCASVVLLVSTEGLAANPLPA